MPCCGSKRQLLSQTLNPPKSKSLSQPVGRHFEVTFEYVGNTALTAVGPVSGRHYRFERAGARVTVDPRDRPGLATIPHLRQLW